MNATMNLHENSDRHRRSSSRRWFCATAASGWPGIAAGSLLAPKPGAKTPTSSNPLAPQTAFRGEGESG
jgi:hypothetical protein